MTTRWIYIGGIERSGTTILAAFLAAHLEGVALPESQFKKHLFAPGTIGRHDLQALAYSFRFRLWDIGLNIDAFTELEGREIWHGIVANLFAEHAIRAPSVIIDHTPDNIRFADDLLGAFGAACFCHIMRDPRAVVASLMSTDWMIPSVAMALRFWHRKNLSAERLLLNRSRTTRVLHIRYEDLCRNPESVLAVVSPIRMTASDGSGCGGSILLPTYTRAQHKRIALAPSDKEEWRNRLTEEEALFIERELADTVIGRLYNFRKHKVNLSRVRELQHLSKLPRLWVGSRFRRRRRSVVKVMLEHPSSTQQAG